jgi:DNA processing protein
MNDPVSTARLRLFAAIEGGSGFWGHEIAQSGPLAVLDGIERNSYEEASASAIRARLVELEGSALLTQLLESGAFLLTPESEDWPQGLQDLYSPPIALLGKGRREVLNEVAASISIVGTRNPTDYGSRIASDFAAGASQREWSVVSGGAYGIDAAAHRGALIAGGSTIAILAGGFDLPYPAGHERLFREISESGLLLAEVMPHVRAMPFRFLTRNRLIAAISKATIVVEAAYRSGSLRTARDAAELMRMVLAVPGPITSPVSEGCHRLIAERSAELVTSITEVFELIEPLN